MSEKALKYFWKLYHAEHQPCKRYWFWLGYHKPQLALAMIISERFPHE